jgi:hypothetical protein
MGREEIERLIRHYFRENYLLDPNIFPDLIFKALDMASVTAKAYWDHRTKAEIERDKSAEVTSADYETWIINELFELKKGALYN